jgi:TetR/AcrR family fatty acid metabolism transcriptional regulator
MLLLKQNRRFLDTKAHKSIRSQIKIYDQVLQEGMDTGEFRSDIDLYLLRSASIGAMEHIITNWLMLGYPEIDKILEMVDSMIDTLVFGIQNKEKAFTCPFEQLRMGKSNDDMDSSSSKLMKKK